MSKIFVSYRRSISEHAAGRLANDLRHAFGSARVFRDRESIRGGVAFKSVIESAIGPDSVMLVLIPSGWAELKDDQGNCRLFDEHDLVRIEVVTALRRAKLVIPILVENSSIPSKTALPDDLSSLPGLNALRLRDADWPADIERIIDAVAGGGIRRRRKFWPHVTLFSLSLFVTAGAGWYALSLPACFTHPGGRLEQRDGNWIEYIANKQIAVHKVLRRDWDWIYTYDDSRYPSEPGQALNLRIPIRGGTVQWTKSNPIFWIDLYVVRPTNCTSLNN